MQALLRYPRSKRSAIAREWARRSQAVQATARIARGPDADTLRFRALHDARGQVLREGVSFTDGKTVAWRIVHSRRGRTNQVDFEIDGARWRTGSLRMANKLARA